jgi:pyridoxal phosphate enzyme (YggS family)
MIEGKSDSNLWDMDTQLKRIRANFQYVQDRIILAAQSADRHPEKVRLMVVTKGHQLEVVQAVLAAGAHLLGENYVEEALVKMQTLSTESGIEWHMIGHVQSRKADLVSQNFSCVHSVDSVKLAKRLDHFASEESRCLPVLLECNVSHEESKYGWKAWDESGWDALADDIKPLLDLPALEVRGLMTMPPFFQNPESTRPYFQKLRRLQAFLQERFPLTSWTELSMGMSGDFEVAIQEGATIVRIGTAILGERKG